jgi:hypothetical protein
MFGSIRKLPVEEIQKLTEKIVIRGRPYNGNLLDIATIDSLELLPTYQIETDEERVVYVSAPYKKSGYIAFVGYVEDGDKLAARTFFYSRSEGIARLLRRYKYEEIINEEGEKKDKVTWNDKGYSEKSIALPIVIQIGQIDNVSKITSLGIRSKWVDSGCLTTPAWEYLIDHID